MKKILTLDEFIDENHNPMRAKAEKIYAKWDGKTSVQTLKGKQETLSIILPGNYTVLETDYEGQRDSEILDFKVTSKIESKELAIQIAERSGYVSPWGYMRLREITSYRGDINFPKHPELF